MESNEKEYKNYARNMFGLLVHIAMGYRIGSFINYYPTEHMRLYELFSMESFPTLLLGCPSYMNIPWVQILIYSKELIRMLEFDNGYQLVASLLAAKGSEILQNSGPECLDIIDKHFFYQRQTKAWRKNRKGALEILAHLAKNRSLYERAERLRNAIEKQ